MYKFVLTWWKNSIKQCFCHQELPCCLISTSSPALNNKTSFAQVMMVQVGTVTTLLVLFGGTVNDYILFMVEHWSCFAKNWGGGGGAKNVIQKSPRKGAGAEKSPNPIFIHPRNSAKSKDNYTKPSGNDPWGLPRSSMLSRMILSSKCSVRNPQRPPSTSLLDPPSWHTSN